MGDQFQRESVLKGVSRQEGTAVPLEEPRVCKETKEVRHHLVLLVFAEESLHLTLLPRPWDPQSVRGSGEGKQRLKS